MSIENALEKAKLARDPFLIVPDATLEGLVWAGEKGLLERLIEANDLKTDDLAASFFTTSPDLDAEYPAVAARQMGWEYVPLICGHEMNVP